MNTEIICFQFKEFYEPFMTLQSIGFKFFAKIMKGSCVFCGSSCISFNPTSHLKTRKLQTEGTSSAIFVIKTPCYDCCVPNVVYFYDHQICIIFPWTQWNLNLEIKRKLNFNDSLWQFNIWNISDMGEVCEIRASIPSVSLSETFASNRPFICNYTKLSSNEIREKFCEGLKWMGKLFEKNVRDKTCHFLDIL